MLLPLYPTCYREGSALSCSSRATLASPFGRIGSSSPGSRRVLRHSSARWGPCRSLRAPGTKRAAKPAHRIGGKYALPRQDYVVQGKVINSDLSRNCGPLLSQFASSAGISANNGACAANDSCETVTALNHGQCHFEEDSVSPLLFRREAMLHWLNLEPRPSMLLFGVKGCRILT
jgi:hypothetical protein